MKQLSAMGNRRHYYRNSASSRSMQHQQHATNEQLNGLNSALVGASQQMSNQQQQGIGITMNIQPSLINRTLQTQQTQNQTINNC